MDSRKMYEAFFGFSRRPFSSAPRLEDYFASAGMENARQTLCRCLERGAGWGLVIGSAGLGKTLLCQRLAQDLQNRFQIVLLSGGGITRRGELWQTFLYVLGQPYRGMKEGELRLALVEYLAAQQKQTSGLILLVDEAHCLPSKLLEEIRLLSSLPGMDPAWFRVMLAGTGVLEERLSSPRLEAFSQRIVARCYLEPWSRTETQSYIQTQLQKVCSQAVLPIPEEAALAVFQATGGIPRLVNQLCDHALFWASVQGVRVLDAKAIEETWAELQQLPPPSSGQTAPVSEHSVVEFSILSEEDDFPNGPPGPACAVQEVYSENSLGQAPSQQKNSPTEPLEAEISGDSPAPASPKETDLANTFSSEPLETRIPSGEEQSSCPSLEKELFFGPVAESSSEASSLGSFLHQGADSEETSFGRTSAWQHLEEIERALWKMTDHAGSGETDPGCISEAVLESDSAARGRSVGNPASAETGCSASEAEVWEEMLSSSTQESCATDREKEMVENGVSCSGSPSCSGTGSLSQTAPSPQSAEPFRNCSKPEVELVFGPSRSLSSCSEASRMENDPFAESFLEEEWLEDPYLCLGMEGQRAWSVLALQRQEGIDSPTQVPQAPSQQGDSQGFRPARKGALGSSPLPPPERWGLYKSPSLPSGTCSAQNKSQDLGGLEGSPKPTAPGELPLIVIEENLEEPPPPPKSPVIPVTRQEYRHLFARLRRG